jgi:competence protein ComEC
MASATTQPISTERLPRQLPVWSAPLVPVALAMTAGIVMDRFYLVPLPASLGVALASLLAWLIFAKTSRQWLALLYLWTGVAGLAAAYHHWHRYHIDPSDIQHFADYDGKPARLRGTLQSAPTAQLAERGPLRSFSTKDTTRFVLRVAQRQELRERTWHPVTGLVQVTVVGHTGDITVGDEVELLGRLAHPAEAMNPGELDYASFLRDQGITATFTVLESDEVTLTRRGWPTSLFGWLAVVRGWGQRTLQRDLSGQQSIAEALLLGEAASMTGADWEKYQRTGVIHVLAISGQHLVVLAGFLWLLARVLGIRRRYAAPSIALFLIAYALLTGGRPPVMRAAWVVGAYCGGVLLRRPIARANAFALGWIGVIVMNPTDIFNAGCQLSFLAVVMLIWGVGRWSGEVSDPLQRIIEASSPWYSRVTFWILRWLAAAYAINAAVWIAVSPLVAAHFHNVSPIALLLGPPMVVLTSIALLAGFAFLLFAAWCYPLAWLFAIVTQGSLSCCDVLVSLGQRLPGAYFFVADVPAWWLWGFYVPVLIGITLPWVWRNGRWALGAVCIWLALGVLLQAMPRRPGEFRCTFVAVGHGGCTVLETPGGRVIVYDAGATSGPNVTRRHIAPLLWSRGIRRIDELILSHADLDHFNGVPQLAERFAIGRVLCTPTFAERNMAAVQKTVEVLQTHGIPMQIVHTGKHWEEDGIAFRVLHPPLVGPAGKENVRSLVLLVTTLEEPGARGKERERWSMLLTGDLEEAGLEQVLMQRPPRIDVLMAPHHGSDKSNIPELAKWAKPRLVVSCQAAPPGGERLNVKMYEKAGAKFLGTWPHGSITIRTPAGDVRRARGEEEGGASVETFRTKLLLRPF